MNAHQRQLDTLYRLLLRAIANNDRFSAIMFGARIRALR